jgi:hypothetical protein
MKSAAENNSKINMNENIIEEKITQLLREEKLHLKNHLISRNQNFP